MTKGQSLWWVAKLKWEENKCYSMSTELSILSWNGNQNEDREGAGWRLEKHLWLKNSCDRFLLPIHPPKKEDSFLLSPSSKISKHRWAPLLRPKQKALILKGSWIQILALPLASHVTLRKLLRVFNFVPKQNGINSRNYHQKWFKKSDNKMLIS